MCTVAAVTVGILFTVSMFFYIGMCRAASDADDRMEELFRRKEDKEGWDFSADYSGAGIPR